MADNAASKRPGDAVDLNEEASPRDGEWLFAGHHGLPKDPVRARPWLKKVVDGDCKPNILTDGPIAEAARMLRELDGAGD